MVQQQIVWTNSDGESVTARDYIDLDPFDTNGMPKNNWEPLQEKVFTKVSKKTKDGKNMMFHLFGVECLHLV
jgi:hypothetical protein